MCDSIAVVDSGVARVWCEGAQKYIKLFLPAALRAAQICRYLIYSEADFEVFHPHRCNDKGVGPPKLKFLLRFDRNVEYKRPAGAYPLRDFHKVCTVCTSL